MQRRCAPQPASPVGDVNLNMFTRYDNAIGPLTILYFPAGGMAFESQSKHAQAKE